MALMLTVCAALCVAVWLVLGLVRRRSDRRADAIRWARGRALPGWGFGSRVAPPLPSPPERRVVLTFRGVPTATVAVPGELFAVGTPESAADITRRVVDAGPRLGPLLPPRGTFAPSEVRRD